MSDFLARTAPGTPAFVGADAALRQVALSREHAVGCTVESPSLAQIFFGATRGAAKRRQVSTLYTTAGGLSRLATLSRIHT